MDQQKRMFLFLLLSFSTMFLWIRVGLPFFYPELGKPAPGQQVEKKEDQESDLTERKKADTPGSDSEQKDVALIEKAETHADKKEVKPSQEEPAEVKLPSFPRRKITLGESNPESKHFITVEFSSRGAVLTALRLNDKRYPALHDREQPLQLLGEVPGSSRLTFDMRIKAIDEQLARLERGLNLELVDWEVVEETLSPSQVTFRYPSPDGRLEVLKTFELLEADPARRDSDPNGYCLNLTLQFRNLSEREMELDYKLQGPVGIPLENAQDARRYLAIQAGFLKDGEVTHKTVSAGDVAAQVTKNKLEPFQAPIRYVGVDGQYFAALLIPQEDQEKNNWLDSIQPLLLKKTSDAKKSLISLKLESRLLALSPGQTHAETYTMFAGPKRDALLRPFDADGIIEYGWFGSISKIMLAVMNFFHSALHAPYGLAIIMLTILVRGLMFPISRKHAKSAKKMKEMQPKFEAIKKKYSDPKDKEKLARAQMELMKESGFFSGCLPMLLQLPIFIGLYQALSTSVDLRMAPFLWIDNLAAPDHLFRLPFTIPWLGEYFNLLPMIAVGLFIVQQKLFAPPPANEEQALQQKMMSYMMILIGFMLYRIPAGLGVYFIASSLWAIAERKMLDVNSPSSDKPENSPSAAVSENKKSDPEPPKKASWLQKKLEALDAAANPTTSQSTKLKSSPSKKSKKRKKR